MKKIIYLLSICSVMSSLYSCGEDDDVIASLSEKQMLHYGTYGNYKLHSISSDGYHQFYYNEKGIIEKTTLRQGIGSKYDTGEFDNYIFSAGLDTLRSVGGKRNETYALKFNKNGYLTKTVYILSNGQENDAYTSFEYDSKGYLTKRGNAKIEWKNGCPIRISSGEVSTREGSGTPDVGYTVDFHYDSNIENIYGIYSLPFFYLLHDSPTATMKITEMLGILGMLGNAPRLLPDSVVFTSYKADNNSYPFTRSYVYQLDKDKQFAIGWEPGNYFQYFNFE